MHKETLYNIEPTGPLWTVEDVNNKNAKVRGKKNTKWNDSRSSSPPLFSKSTKIIDGGVNTVGLLHRELRFLEKLRDSGVTPKAFGIKVDVDKKCAHLLIEQLPGKSFESLGKPTEEQLQHLEQVMVSILEAISKIHQKGVLVTDVNEGTFLLNSMEGHDAKPEVRVVDFELAVDERNLNSPPMQNYLKDWYSSRDDIGIRINSRDKNFNISPDEARSAERYLSVKYALDFFLGSKWEKFDRTLLDIKEYEEYLSEVKNLTSDLQELTSDNLSKQYAYKKRVATPLEKLGTENEFIKKHKSEIFEQLMNKATSYIILPKLFASRNISISQPCLVYLQKTLSPYLSRRPKYPINNLGKQTKIA